MKVFWDPNCLLHDPPYEILSGYKVPYFESPSRLQVIKKELEEHPSLFQVESTDSSSGPGSIDILGHIEMVHGRGYLSYLRNAYDEWVRDGGSAVPLADHGFLRFSTHNSFRTRCYREHSHIRNCYLDLVKAKSMLCVPLPKQVSKFGMWELPFWLRGLISGYYCFDLSCPIVKGQLTTTFRACHSGLNTYFLMLSDLFVRNRLCWRRLVRRSRTCDSFRPLWTQDRCVRSVVSPSFKNFRCSLRIKLTIQPSPGSSRRNLPFRGILFRQ
jgi:hypothetical protein